MAKPIHSMIRVLDEARSVDFYRRALGLEVVDRLAFDGFTLLYLRAPEGPFELELTVNHDRTAPYALGDGYGHLAVAVEDLAAEHARMSAAGIDAARCARCSTRASRWRASSSSPIRTATRPRCCSASAATPDKQRKQGRNNA